MADPIKWKSKIILAKMEGAYGVDAGPSGAANAMLLTDVQLQPMEGEEVSRNLELPYLGAQEQVPTGLRSVLSGSFELVGSGTPGVPPAWGPLLRACGVAEIVTPDTSVEYLPISDGHESVTLRWGMGPWWHPIPGSRGTAVISLNAQGIPVCRVTLTGFYVRPTDQVRPAVDLSKWQKPQIASKKNTPMVRIAGIDFVARSLELNLGNDVQPRLLIGDEKIVIVDRNDSLSATVEAVPYATYNPFQRAEELTPTEVRLQHGTVDGRRVEIRAAQATQRRPTGLENGQNAAEWPLGFTPMPTSAGNDQWSIKLT